MLYAVLATFADIMTKKRTPASSARTTNPSKTSYREKILGSKRFQAIKKMVAPAKVIIAIIAMAWCVTDLFAGSGTAQYAMLYLIADSAKKSGRAGGNVYMRNGRIRSFTVPSLVQNEATSTQRNNFSQFSTAWNALSAADQVSWNEATGYFKSDRFGQAIPLVGKELFIALNRSLFNVGNPQIDTAPLPGSVPAIDSLVVTASTAAGGSLTVTYSPDLTPGGGNFIKVFATAQLSPGTFRPGKSKYRLLMVLDDTATSPESIFTQYVARHGALVAGRKIFIKLVGVNGTTGQQSSGIIASDIVA